MNIQKDTRAPHEPSAAAQNRIIRVCHIQYNPGNLLDALIEYLNLKNDAALARVLVVEPPIISKIRHQSLPVGGAMLIRMHEESKLTISELRTLLGDRRQKFRISDKQFKPKTDGTVQSN